MSNSNQYETFGKKPKNFHVDIESHIQNRQYYTINQQSWNKDEIFQQLVSESGV